MKLMFFYSNEVFGIGMRVALRSKARASYDNRPRALEFEPSTACSAGEKGSRLPLMGKPLPHVREGTDFIFSASSKINLSPVSAIFRTGQIDFSKSAKNKISPYSSSPCLLSAIAVGDGRLVNA